MGYKAKLRASRKLNNYRKKDHSEKNVRARNRQASNISLSDNTYFMCRYNQYQITDVYWCDDGSGEFDIYATYQKYQELGIFLRIGETVKFVRESCLRSTQTASMAMLEVVASNPDYVAIGLPEYQDLFRVKLVSVKKITTSPHR